MSDHPIIDCIIPAKGTSRRFPRKNLAMMDDGVHVIGLAIRAAKESGVFRYVRVSTEDKEITRVAKSYGAVVDERNGALAEDDVSVKDVVVNWLDMLEYYLDMIPLPPTEYVAIIYPTAWGLLATDIKGMWEKLKSHEDAHGIMSVVRPLEHPSGALQTAGNLLYLRYTDNRDDDGYYVDDDALLTYSQKQKLVADAGYCYIYRVDAFKKWGFYPERLLGYELPR